MIKILQAYSIPERPVHAIETMYQNTKARLLTPDDETEQFDITAGVMQGRCICSILIHRCSRLCVRGVLNGYEEQLGSPYHQEDHKDSPQLH